MAERKVKKPDLNEIATTRNDPDIFAGWTLRLENPDTVLRTEGGSKGIRLYDEVDRDPHAGSVLQTRYLSVAGKEWEVLPASDSARDKTVADFVRDAFESLNFTQGLAELMQAALYGHYESEIMWRADGAAIVPARLVGKHPRRFVFDFDRRLRMLTPENLADGEDVPERKFIHFAFGSADNPYGKGLGQKLWWPVWFKKHGIKFWLIFLEKFGMPTIFGKYPSGTTTDQQQALLDAIEAIQSDTGVKIPESMGLELLEATRAGNVTHASLCDYMDRQISKAVLGQTLTTEVKGEGSYAASQTHNDVRQDILKADADMLCECLNNSLVKWTVDYNFVVSDYPKLWLRTDEEEDLNAVVERDRTLARDIGVPISMRYFYDTYNIPEPEAGEEVVAPTATPDGMFSEPGMSAGQRPIEGLVDRMTGQAADVMAGIEAPVRRLLETSETIDEFRDRLYAAYAEADPDALEETMARALFAAEMHGRQAIARRTRKA